MSNDQHIDDCDTHKYTAALEKWERKNKINKFFFSFVFFFFPYTAVAAISWPQKALDLPNRKSAISLSRTHANSKRNTKINKKCSSFLTKKKNWLLANLIWGWLRKVLTFLFFYRRKSDGRPVNTGNQPSMTETANSFCCCYLSDRTWFSVRYTLTTHTHTRENIGREKKDNKSERLCFEATSGSLANKWQGSHTHTHSGLPAESSRQTRRTKT